MPGFFELAPALPNPAPSLIETDGARPDFSSLRTQGIVLLRGAYDDLAVATMRQGLESVIEKSRRAGWGYRTHPKYPEGWTVDGDVLTMEEIRDLDYIAFHPRIVGWAKEILGQDIVYYGESCIRTGNGGRGFHKDFLVDTRSDALALRFALYLEDHSEHGGALKVRLRSQRRVSRHVGVMMNVHTRAGDLVVFDPRLSHTGNSVRLRAWPKLCLHPKVENLLPPSMLFPEERPRICLLWTFAKPGDYLDRYIPWITSLRPEHWWRSDWDDSALDLARRRGVRMRVGLPEQGCQAQPARHAAAVALPSSA